MMEKFYVQDEESLYIHECKEFVLPKILKNSIHILEIKIFINERFFISCDYAPIRYGNTFGSKIGMSGSYDINTCPIDYSPTLLWNGKEWLLSTFGHFYFVEHEFNYKKGE